jgi:pantoate--beta-alanine ligase
MKTILSIQSMQRVLSKQSSLKIGLVPTMGALHEGHLSLMRVAKRECDIVVVSIFVNPLQFGESADLKRYPRDLTADRKMAQAEGVDFLFVPKATEIVPQDLETKVSVDKVAKRWEGAMRPGHFQGVATIVAKLFLIVKPAVAYFGQKDYQQTVVVRKMTNDLNFNLKLRILPTVRESNGLAKSSRNQFLSEKERASSAVLYRALQYAKQAVQKGERECAFLKKQIESMLTSESAVHLDYIAFCHKDTLEPVLQVTRKIVLLIAVRVGKVRLIDNIILDGKC